ncbi:M14 family metallopeptidase [Fulvivirga aurantia]|uniref:M14 family metallopeptidase n=1 Tax=Fulvivirga aurantia TaxID=2529383 RepID=UPI001FE4DF75|nr:M14 family metallopeptidase [Fulvivirga aurantia]
MKNIIAALLFSFITINTIAQSIQSPKEFLGYELGERFTRHHRVVDYFRYVGENMPNVTVEQYGETYEHRPLITATFSSPENMAKIEEIRKNNLRRAKLEDGSATQDDIAIVWLSYNIHGNEASSIEASMATIYELLTSDRGKEWLKNTVVIMDPCINPDGRDRYANFYNQYGASNFNPNGDAIEHHEPWPGGRPNHYLFDLNRDWAWQTQQESTQRAVIYHKWMPHVHVDFHEQGYNSPYYFAPAAEPFHEVITDWQREFQTTIGKNHAKYFDKEGWLYFTKERFDLLYPSYGDTYPTYNGAIGMTYEQAGHGFAGLGIITEYGDTLTLKDRVMHHYTTGISTVEISSQNAAQLSNQFGKYFNEATSSPSARYKTYVISGNNNPDKIDNLLKFLDKQQIRYGTTNSRKSFKGFNFNSNSSSNVTLSGKDVIISTYQPKSKLVTSLFEPVAKLSDSLTYDITAWSLPYAYGLETYALTDRINVDNTYNKVDVNNSLSADKPYAYISKYNSLDDVKWLSAILQEGINARVATKPFSLQGKSYDRGTIVITRRTNEKFGSKFDELIKKHAADYYRQIDAVTTGFADSGTDLGSGDIARLKAPKVALLAGEQTSSLGFGEIWHFFEQQINYPVTAIGTDYFNQVELSDYDVLIVPNGWYSLFDESTLKNVSSWVRDGGKLILVGYALNAFKDKNGFGLKEFRSDEEKKALDKEPTEQEILMNYNKEERDRLSSSIFGAIFKISLDNTHPLAYGYGREYFTLKTSSARYAFLDNGGNVGILKGEAQPVSGFAGYKATEKLEDSLVFGVQDKGSGHVIYMVDNPLFRAFWENGKLLFSNAVFIVD